MSDVVGSFVDDKKNNPGLHTQYELSDKWIKEGQTGRQADWRRNLFMWNAWQKLDSAAVSSSDWWSHTEAEKHKNAPTATFSEHDTRRAVFKHKRSKTFPCSCAEEPINIESSKHTLVREGQISHPHKHRQTRGGSTPRTASLIFC